MSACGEQVSVAEDFAEMVRASNETFASCWPRVERRFNRAQQAYVLEGGVAFPLGFGLEQAFWDECSSGPRGAALRRFFMLRGLCSPFAMAGAAFLCARSRVSTGACDLTTAVADFGKLGLAAYWRTAGPSGLPKDITVNRHGQRVPIEFAGAVGCLEFLADQVPSEGLYFRNEVASFEPERFRACVPKGGVTFTDVDWKWPVTVSVEKLMGILKRRNTRIFDALMFVGFTYAPPYPQLSALAFDREPRGLRITMQEHYKLLFVEEDGAWRLSRVEQLMYRDL